MHPAKDAQARAQVIGVPLSQECVLPNGTLIIGAFTLDQSRSNRVAARNEIVYDHRGKPACRLPVC